MQGMIAVVELDGGAGNGNIQPAKGFDGPGDGVSHLPGVSDIGRQGQGLVAGRLKLGGDLFDPLGGYTSHRNTRPFGRHMAGCRRSDAAATTSDEGDFVL
jgi:hypothetical protein